MHSKYVYADCVEQKTAALASTTFYLISIVKCSCKKVPEDASERSCFFCISYFGEKRINPYKRRFLIAVVFFNKCKHT